MNILVVGKFHTESFALHIAETLEDMNHTVLRFEPGTKGRHITNDNFLFFKKARNTIEGLIVNTEFVRKKELQEIKNLLNTKVDLTIATHDFLYPDQVGGIKEKTKAPIVLWHPDHIANCGKFMFMNAPYDFLFFKDPFMVRTFKDNYNLNTHYLPECCNPKKHYPVTLDNKDKAYYGCDITTAGNMHPSRYAFFKELKDYNIKLWGPPAPEWMSLGPVKKMMMNKTVFNEEKSKAFQAAKIVINNLFPAEIEGVNVRTFEIPACGGFQMINWKPGLDQILKEGDEVVSFRNKEEIIEKIDYYLKNDDERKRIIENGYRKVNAEHTYKIRLKLLLETIFNDAEGFTPPPTMF
jgi:spore maturation protein CgeB